MEIKGIYYLANRIGLGLMIDQKNKGLSAC